MDTCVLLYATAPGHAHFRAATLALVSAGVTSPQVLAEFTAVARGRLRRSWTEVHEALSIFRIVCPKVAPVRAGTFEAALEVMQQERLSMPDAMVVACALKAGCSQLVTSMADDGRVLSETLAVRNPFGPARPGRRSGRQHEAPDEGGAPDRPDRHGPQRAPG